jgi:hypothetical protein
MNANASRNNANVSRNNSKKPYCKVCHDAGKPESMYTSHCVKTYNVSTGATNVTCPTLLALECRYCFKNGHTVKFCPVLEDNRKMDVERSRFRAREENSRNIQARPVEAQTRKPVNAFASLVDDSDDEQETKIATKIATQESKKVDEFPSLNGFSRVAQNSSAKSYSCIAATPVDEIRKEYLRKETFRKEEVAKKAVKWVDEADSSDEEEEEEEEEVVRIVQPSAQPSYAFASYVEDDDW